MQAAGHAHHRLRDLLPYDDCSTCSAPPLRSHTRLATETTFSEGVSRTARLRFQAARVSRNVSAPFPCTCPSGLQPPAATTARLQRRTPHGPGDPGADENDERRIHRDGWGAARAPDRRRRDGGGAGGVAGGNELFIRERDRERASFSPRGCLRTSSSSRPQIHPQLRILLPVRPRPRSSFLPRRPALPADSPAIASPAHRASSGASPAPAFLHRLASPTRKLRARPRRDAAPPCSQLQRHLGHA